MFWKAMLRRSNCISGWDSSICTHFRCFMKIPAGQTSSCMNTGFDKISHLAKASVPYSHKIRGAFPDTNCSMRLIKGNPVEWQIIICVSPDCGLALFIFLTNTFFQRLCRCFRAKYLVLAGLFDVRALRKYHRDFQQYLPDFSLSYIGGEVTKIVAPLLFMTGYMLLEFISSYSAAIGISIILTVWSWAAICE